ncbi:hypothetical protein D9613_005774 [Agrocybe pediades]|uniref:Uncharacterized protein n=1 Tax=Agrocybe pediades TaxID=84607 RepID=A0A8H4QVR4_9AGAR|nr:hypothetical protein D9613_005774 [Agrocybe pediades]
MLKTLLVLIATSLFATVRSSALPSRMALVGRQIIPSANVVKCDFVLQPTAIIDPNATDELSHEFDVVIANALRAQPGIDTGFVTPITIIYIANLDAKNTFNVEETLGAEKLTSAQTTAIIEGWLGTTIPGQFSNWIVNTAACVPSNILEA